MEIATEKLIKENFKPVDGYMYCPSCGEPELGVYFNSPWFFRCEECGNVIFMTSKELFDDMNTQLEETYKKEKADAVKNALAGAKE